MIAQKIRQLRQNKGISQKELAQAIHVSPAAISQYENGRSQPSRENMALLAAYFNVTVAYIEGTSQIEELEDQMNEEYVKGLAVQKFIKNCLRVAKSDREHVVRIVEALAESGIHRR